MSVRKALDAAYFIISEVLVKQVEDFSLSHYLLTICLKKLTCQMNARKNHPFLEDFSKERLWNYPFIDFTNQRAFASIGIPTPELKMSIYETRRENDKHHPLLNQYRQMLEKTLLGL